MSGLGFKHFDRESSVNDLDLSIYPNPAKDQVNVVLKDVIAELAIYSSTGQKISEHGSFTGTKVIDVTNLPTGLYILKFVTENGVYTERLIIE